MQISIAQRLPTCAGPFPKTRPAGAVRNSFLSEASIPSEHSQKAVKPPYGGYRGAKLRPDGRLRINDPERCLDADRELISILEALATLNRTGLYSAFYDYAPHVGTLTIQVCEGW